MTLDQILYGAGLRLTKTQRRGMGKRIAKAVIERNLPHKKIPEIHYVNDYPPEVIPEIETMIIECLKSKMK